MHQAGIFVPFPALTFQQCHITTGHLPDIGIQLVKPRLMIWRAIASPSKLCAVYGSVGQPFCSHSAIGCDKAAWDMVDVETGAHCIVNNAQAQAYPVDIEQAPEHIDKMDNVVTEVWH